MRNRFIKPVAQYADYLSDLKNCKKKFKVTHYGSTYKIAYDNRLWVFGNRIEAENKDVVLACRLVKRDCDIAIKNGLVHEDKDVVENFKTKIFNRDIFDKYNQFYGFDIEACYWNIAYNNVPILSMQTYASLYEQKDIRNIALGCLGRIEVEEEYDCGEMVSRLPIKSIYYNLYAQIRYKAHQWFLAINDICNNEVGLYKTDEYIIPEKYALEVLRFLKAEGAFDKSGQNKIYDVKKLSAHGVMLQNAVYEEDARFIA
jgi:hypothetical protein